MNDIAIKVENLGKRYRIGASQQQANGWGQSLKNMARAPFEYLLNSLREPTEAETLWSLRNVSFEVKHGEIVGIIGRNGAGKSTLLKILTRITEPTEGRARVYGRVGSLLEVGTGFHLELTGRENIFMNGAILGMTGTEIKRKFDEIVDFAGVEKFIDTPVKRYSSGMRVRLGFAVAAYLDPEILLVDEVLAVGDLAFQKKCLGKMQNVTQEGRTVLFVSHNMQSIQTLCPRAVLINDGKIVTDGVAEDVIGIYHATNRSQKVNLANIGIHDPDRRGSGAVRFTQVEICGEHGRESLQFEMGQTVRFVLTYRVLASVENLHVSIALHSSTSLERITSVRFLIDENPLPAGHVGSAVIELPNIKLRPGEYPLYLWLGDNFSQPYDVVDDLLPPLRIYTNKGLEDLGFNPTNKSGFINIKARILSGGTDIYHNQFY